jgi:hypothetical protein
MSTTYIVKAAFTDRLKGPQEFYWDGRSWTKQMWDAAHFIEEGDVNDFIEYFCADARKGGWNFFIVPIDFENS